MIKTKNLNVVFMGTQIWAAQVLQSLLDSEYNIISVYTQPKSPVGSLAKKNKIKTFEPQKFDEKVFNELKSQSPDLIIVAAYGKILPQNILDIPKLGAINVHPSLLPKYRGPSPVQNAILNGEIKTGTTIMLMDKGIDSGNILSQKEISIGPDETFPELLERLTKLSIELLLETIPLWIEKKITPQKQDDSKATHCQLIERQDGKIIWTEGAASIYNRFRAFYPWPGIFAYWEKDGRNLRIKLQKITLAQNYTESGKKLGEVFSLDKKVAVQAGSGAIILDEIQLEGKDRANASDFINGYPQFIGSVLK